MGMTLKELLTKGEGTLSAQEAKALAAQCRMDVDTLYTLLEEESEPSLDVDSIIAEVENAENNNDDMGLADENEEDAEENPADLKAAMDELLDDPVKNYLKQIGQIPHPCRCRGCTHSAGRPPEVRRTGVHQEEQRPLLL